MSDDYEGETVLFARSPAKRAGPFRTIRSLRLYLVKVNHNQCPRCKEVYSFPYFHLDHAIPLSLGGFDRDEDLQLLCHICHRKKTKIDLIILTAARRLGYVERTWLWSHRDFLREFYLTNYEQVETVLTRKRKGWAA